MDIPRYTDIISQGIAANDSSIAEIVKAAQDPNFVSMSDDDRMYSLAASGFALGVHHLMNEARNLSLQFPLASLENNEFLRNTLARLNEWMLTDANVDQDWMAKVRTPIVEFLEKETAAYKAIVVSRFHKATGIKVNTLLSDEPITDTEAMDAAVSCLQTNSSIYMGFMLFYGDTAHVPTQRPYQFANAYAHTIDATPAVITKITLQKYGTQSAALIAFGRWFLEDIRKIIAGLEEGRDGQGIVDHEEANKTVSSVFARLFGITR